jgi:hypothetical protein
VSLKPFSYFNPKLSIRSNPMWESHISVKGRGPVRRAAIRYIASRIGPTYE